MVRCRLGDYTAASSADRPGRKPPTGTSDPDLFAGHILPSHDMLNGRQRAASLWRLAQQHQYVRPSSQNGPKALWNGLLEFGGRGEEPRDSFCEGDQTGVTRDQIKEHIDEFCDLQGKWTWASLARCDVAGIYTDANVDRPRFDERMGEHSHD